MASKNINVENFRLAVVGFIEQSNSKYFSKQDIAKYLLLKHSDEFDSLQLVPLLGKLIYSACQFGIIQKVREEKTSGGDSLYKKTDNFQRNIVIFLNTDNNFKCALCTSSSEVVYRYPGTNNLHNVSFCRKCELIIFRLQVFSKNVQFEYLASKNPPQLRHIVDILDLNSI